MPGTQADRVRVGVIGTGAMGALHARNLHRYLSAAELVAIADPDLARAEALAAELGGASAYADGQELISDPRVEAVVISSPDPTHKSYVLACLRAGKPVMCEKPLAATAADGLDIINAESATGRRQVQVGFMREFDPAHIAVRSAVGAGRVGRPVMFRGTHVNPTAIAGVTPAMVITGSMIHDIHSARFLMGQEIATVYVTSLPREPGREDTCRLVTLSCRFDDGALGLIDVNVEAAYGYSVSATVVGTQGTAMTAEPVRAAVLSRFERREDIAPDFPERFAEAYRAELDAWLASLQAGRAIGPSSWDGYASLAVAEACQRSVTSGQPADVDMVGRFGLFA